MRSRKPRLLIAIWLVAIASAFVSPLNHAHAATITTPDEQGANDQPGQKDLTLHSINSDNIQNGTIIVGWNWDEIEFSGNNSGDACALFDTDGDGRVNFAICVTVKTVDGQTGQVAGSPRLYSCGDAKVDRCTTPTQVTNVSSTCGVVSPSATDPFGGTGKNRGDAYPNDTKATCTVQLSDVGGATVANLINTCSYPSQEPNSDPSDCVLIIRDAFVRIVKNASPEDGTFSFTVDGVAIPPITTSGGTGSSGSIGVTSGNNTSHTLAEVVPAGWTLTGISCSDGTSASTGNSVTVSNIPADTTVTCMFTDTKNNPELTLDKRATETSYDEVGDVIHYFYDVTNSGNVSLAGPVTISDNKTAATCPAVSTVGNLNGFLDPGESITCSATYTITQADLNAGSLTNLATASAGGTTSNEDSVTVTADRNPELTLDKRATETSYDEVGDVIHYFYDVTNSGNVSLAGPVTISDNKTAATCPAVSTVGNLNGFLDPGESITCSATYTITQADLNAGSLTNLATASAGGTTSNEDSVTVTADRNPELTLDKRATETSYDEVGDVIHYFYDVTNSGNVSLAGPVTISDNKTAATCPAVSTVGNLNGFLDPGESITCSATYTITQADLNAGSLTNLATASAGGTTSNEDTVTIDADQNPELTLIKSSTESSYDAVNDVIHYAYVVENTGNVRLAGPVTIDDDITTNETCPAVTSVGNGDAFLDPDEIITCEASYTITQDDLNAGSVTNKATASAGGTTSNEDSVTVTAEQRRSLLLVKSADVETYDEVGDIINYEYVVTNNGNVSLEGPVTIADDITTNESCPNVNTVGNLDGFLDPDESITCTSSHTVTQEDLNDGSITNTAKATADEIDSNEDSVTVDADQKPELTLAKRATETSYDEVGDVIHYFYDVENTGNVRIAGPVTIDDDITTNESCPDVNTVGNLDSFLDPGESITCDSTYTITQDDLNAGSVTNKATASAGGTTSNEDSVTVTAEQRRSLLLVKSADVETYDEVGDIINYEYVVTNNGNVSLEGPVTIADDITTNESCPNVNTVGNLDGFLDPDESITCTSSHTVTQEDLNDGSITNTAKATADEIDSNEDSVTVDADQNPSLAIEKSADVETYDEVGDIINYDYEVTNNGNVSLAGPITIDDDITTNESCPNVNTVGNLNGFLDPDESITCTSSYTITQEDLNDGSVTNVAKATAGDTTSPPDTVTVDADQNPSLEIEKTADVDTYDAVGDVINYDYKVTNDGNVSLAGPITIDDDITTNESCPDVNTVGNNDAFLDPDEFIICTSSYTITQADLDRGSVTNAATATNGTTTSPPDTVTVPADQNPHIDVEKTGTLEVGDDNRATPGDEISYTITVTNDGNVTLDPVVVEDTLLDELECEATVLAPGASMDCIGTYVITQADIDTGKVTNTATGTGTPPTGPDVTDSDTFDVTIGQVKDMAVAKAQTSNADQDESGTITEGDHITYTITVSNPGNVTLTNVTVSDSIPPQTTFVSCGPAGTCTPNGPPVTSVSWTVGPIAPGGSVPVTLTVRVGAITSCQICNIASAVSTQVPAPGRQSPQLCIVALPVDHPEGAHASGSALGAKVRVDLLGINQDIVPVSSSQSGVGHDGDQDSVLSLAIPPPGGAIARLGLITTTTSSTVTDAPARAMNTGTAETLGVNLLNGVVTADVVRGVAHAEANGVGAFISSAGSTFVNLKVSGVTMANVAPNTTVNLPALLFGRGSYVKLYEKVGGTSKPAAGQLSGGTYAGDLTVNMIHVFVKDALPIVPGNQTTEIIVSGATAHADFPQTTVCDIQPARSVSGHAFIASAAVTVDDPEDPLLLGLTEGFVGIPASGGHDHQELPSVVLLEPDGEVLNTEDVSSDSAGNIFGPTITASSYAQAANVCLLEMAGGCTVRATLVKSQANSSAPSSGPPGAPTSNPTGTQLVGLEIAGNPINITPPPNTVINIPGVGFIILNEQFCDGGGTLAAGCTDGLHSGLTVRAIRIVVTLLDPLGIGAEVIVAEAHSDVTRPPYPA